MYLKNKNKNTFQKIAKYLKNLQKKQRNKEIWKKQKEQHIHILKITSFNLSSVSEFIMYNTTMEHAIE